MVDITKPIGETTRDMNAIRDLIIPGLFEDFAGRCDNVRRGVNVDEASGSIVSGDVVLLTRRERDTIPRSELRQHFADRLGVPLSK